jgi:hypothetical protein
MRFRPVRPMPNRVARLLLASNRRSLQRASKGASTPWVGIAALAVSLVALAVSAISFYFQYFRDDSRLVAFANIQGSNTKRLIIHFGFANPGNRTVLVQEVHLFNIQGRISDLEKTNCLAPNVAEQYEFYIKEPTPNPDQPIISPIVSQPDGMLEIDNNKTLSVTDEFVFPAQKLSANSGEILTVCPVYRVSKTSGGEWDIFCNGWRFSIIMKNNEPILITNLQPGTLTLMPIDDKETCTSVEVKN